MTLVEATKTMLLQRCNERGYTLEEVMPCVVEQREDGTWVIDTDHEKYPKVARIDAKIQQQVMESAQKSFGEGVGTELKGLLSMIGIKSSPTCSCNKRARSMNEHGIQWCKDNIPTIVGWLEEEAKKRKLPFLKFAATKIVKLAIYRAEKKQK